MIAPVVGSITMTAPPFACRSGPGSRCPPRAAYYARRETVLGEALQFPSSVSLTSLPGTGVHLADLGEVAAGAVHAVLHDAVRSSQVVLVHDSTPATPTRSFGP